MASGARARAATRSSFIGRGGGELSFDEHWLLVRGELRGTTRFVFVAVDAPNPVVYEVHVIPGLPGASELPRLAVGFWSTAEVPVEGQVGSVDVDGPARVEVRRLGTRVLLEGIEPGKTIVHIHRSQPAQSLKFLVDVAPPSPPGGFFRLRVGESKEVRVDHRLGRLVTGADIVAVTFTSKDRMDLRVTGIAPGRQSILLYTDDGARLSYYVVVDPPSPDATKAH